MSVFFKGGGVREFDAVVVVSCFTRCPLEKKFAVPLGKEPRDHLVAKLLGGALHGPVPDGVERRVALDRLCWRLADPHALDHLIGRPEERLGLLPHLDLLRGLAAHLTHLVDHPHDLALILTGNWPHSAAAAEDLDPTDLTARKKVATFSSSVSQFRHRNTMHRACARA